MGFGQRTAVLWSPLEPFSTVVPWISFIFMDFMLKTVILVRVGLFMRGLLELPLANQLCTWGQNPLADRHIP